MTFNVPTSFPSLLGLPMSHPSPLTYTSWLFCFSCSTTCISRANGGCAPHPTRAPVIPSTSPVVVVLGTRQAIMGVEVATVDGRCPALPCSRSFPPSCFLPTARRPPRLSNPLTVACPYCPFSPTPFPPRTGVTLWATSLLVEVAHSDARASTYTQPTPLERGRPCFYTMALTVDPSRPLAHSPSPPLPYATFPIARSAYFLVSPTTTTTTQ